VGYVDWEAFMLNVNVDNIGDLAVVECEGRIVQSDAAFRLRDAVTLQGDARTVVLDLSEVNAIEGGGLGMLVFLQRWAQDRDIRFKLFNPSRSVRERLKKVSSMSEFDIPTLDEMMALLARADRRYAIAA
jgi:anti-anti-sigma regulatory factor